MGKTQTLEKEILDIHRTYWDGYLSGDWEKSASVIADDMQVTGSTEDEIYYGKAEVIQFIKDSKDQIVGKVQMRNSKINVRFEDPVVLVEEYHDIYFKNGQDWSFYEKLRISSVLKNIDGQWKFIQQHGSVPDSKVEEGETLAMDKISKENLQLKEAIKRRTVELEEKTRQLEIDAALEKIRSQSLQMQHSDELDKTSRIFHKQLLALGIPTEISYVWLPDVENKKHKFWAAWTDTEKKSNQTLSKSVIYDLDMEEPHTKMCFDVWQSDEKYHIVHIPTNDLKGFFDLWKEILGGAENLNPKNFPEGIYYAEAYMKYGCFGINIKQILSANEEEILKRFAIEFQYTYTRFLDLQKAEEQTREARIEAGLERVRSKAMAMHKTEEISEVVTVLFDQLNHLNVPFLQIWITILNLDKDYFDIWFSPLEGVYETPQYFTMPSMYFEDTAIKTWKSKAPFSYRSLNSIAEVDEFINACDAITGSTYFSHGHKIKNYNQLEFIEARFEYGFLSKSNTEPPTETEANILQRFAKVFEQAYIRFLDIQKAEAQTREAQIEMALEKVRSRTMAMHSSLDVGNTMVLLFEELESLGIKTNRNGIILLDDEEHGEIWTAKPNINNVVELISWELDMSLHDLTKQVYRAWKNKNSGSVYPLIGDDLKAYYKVLNKYTDIPVKFNLDTLPKKEWCYTFNFNEGFIYLFIDEKMLQEYEQIPERFASVFGQTYRRYQDLKKAEAQARESQIEASLERVRSKAMAMHNSADLSSAASLVFTELRKLGINPIRSGVALFKKGSRKVQLYSATSSDSGDSLSLVGWAELKGHPVLDEVYESMLRQEDYFPVLQGEQMRKFYQLLLKGFSVPIPDFEKDETQFGHMIFSSISFLYAWSDAHFSEDQIKIFRRFASIVDLTFRRFLDLQKAEAQAREAQIETALERIRSRSMAMHKSDELSEVIVLLFSQLEILNLVIDTCYIDIFDEDNRGFNIWIGAGTAIYPEQVHLPYSNHPIHQLNKKARQNNLDFYSFDEDKKSRDLYFEHFYDKAEGIDVPENRKKDIADGLGISGSAALGDHAGITMWNYRKIIYSKEENEILVRVNKVFQQTYTRFLDLKRAEAQARESQIEAALERVRSKTMAMHNSTDVAETVATMFNEVKGLGIEKIRCGIGIMLDDEEMELWTASDNVSGKAELLVGQLDMTIHPLLKGAYESWENKNENFKYELLDDDLIDYFSIINDHPEYPANFDIAALPKRLVHNEFNFGEGILFVFSPDELQAEAKNIFHRFAKVFGQTYRRYLDLEKAEAQAREAQIEAGLERLRSASMAMHHSEQLHDVVNVLYKELHPLIEDFDIVNIMLNIEPKGLHFWNGLGEKVYDNLYHIPYVDLPLIKTINQAWKSKDGLIEVPHTKAEKDEYFKVAYNHQPVPTERQKMINKAKGMVVMGYFNDNTGIDLIRYKTDLFTEETKNIVTRFSKVFEQTYTRFLDLQKAEAQAREAQIEAALERVRSRSMAMHQSDELREAGTLLFNEITKLGIESITSGYVIMDDDDIGWNYSPDPITNKILPEAIGIYHKNSPVMRSVLKAWKDQKPVHLIELNQEQTKEHSTYIANTSINFPLDAETLIAVSPKELKIHNFNFEQGRIVIVGGTILTEDQIDIMLRFTKVFHQTYRRFLDLKKAEAQAREAQIEAALERVRSRSMAMHKSEELLEVINVISDQLQLLEIKFHNVSFGINDKNKDYEFWMATPHQTYPFKLYIPYIDNPVPNRVQEAKKHERIFFEDILTEEESLEWHKHVFESCDEDFFDAETKNFVLSRPGYNRSTVLMSNIFLTIGNYSLISYSDPENEIFKRFANVFEQSYTRFLDLKKAEAQAREAQIEAALERVRSKAMAMRSSEDIGEAITILFGEIEKFGIETMRVGIGIMKDNKKMDAWTTATTKGKQVLEIAGILEMDIHPSLEMVHTAWQKKETHASYKLEGKDAQDYYEAISEQRNYSLPDSDELRKTHYLNAFLFKDGVLYIFTQQELDIKDIGVFERFTRVFALTYQRYQELIEAEKREKEAKKQASLDRVRGEIASMRSTQDLDRITPIIWSELINLGVPFFRCGVFIMNEEQQNINVFLSDPKGKSLGLMNLDFDTIDLTKESVEAWKKEKIYKAHWDKEGFKAWTKTLSDLGKIKTSKQYQGGDDAPESLHLHFVPFSQGMLYVGHLEPLNEDQLALVRNLAKSFSIAYARYEDFTKLEKAKESIETTLTDLKSTQKQLIQSEKMASLGELTAGIAHEIQNPLNFVNNFSEVSGELLEEIDEELENGEIEEVKAILADIKENLEKINNHGKRADSIVKGMLQHSRSNTGEKVPTDINQLSEEYLNLAYHGLRAKDKSFNATIKTELEPNIGKINIIPQEIGRVLLNIINNAFYACTERLSAEQAGSRSVVKEKSKVVENGYEPTVILRTFTINPPSGGQEGGITVEDNGSGMPKEVIDKIFQPFFTTKPTGQGTGLGLSMSYDIIKAHNGELEVESEVGKGTKFTIKLPNSKN